MKKKVLLASASPRRKKSLKKIVKKFLVVPSRVKEAAISAKTPAALAVKAALAKAEEVALRSSDAAVIGSETFEKHAAFAVTGVKMKKVSDKEILDYVKSGKPLDKAGSYGPQEIEGIFIEKIAGDYENVVGLPVRKVKELLDRINLPANYLLSHKRRVK